jgi:uncharacterized protein YggE
VSTVHVAVIVGWSIAACARPNVAATVVHAVRGVVSPMAQQQDIFGSVDVVVSLDADSRVVGTRIQRSPSAILNGSAFAAARASSFQTEIKDCRPVASDVIYTVDFPEKIKYGVLPSGTRTISVVADATVTRAPDVAYVEARVANAAAFDALRAKLHALGVTDRNIRATRAAVEIKVEAVAGAGSAAVAAAAVPFVDVLGIRYELNDHSAAYREARDLALKDAEFSARRALPPQMLNLGAMLNLDEPRSAATAVPSEFVPFYPRIEGAPAAKLVPPMLQIRATATVTYALISAG